MTKPLLNPDAVPDGYVAPKMDGARMALRGRIPPKQHRQLHLLAQYYGCTISDVVIAFIDHEFGEPSLLDSDPNDGPQAQEELPVSA